MPTFYHIHNGRSQMLEARKVFVDPKLVNANHDIPPELARELLGSGAFVIHNGDYAM